MNNSYRPQITADGLNYIAFSDCLHTPCGIFIRNDDFTKKDIKKAIIRQVADEPAKADSHDDYKIVELVQKHTPFIIDARQPSNRPADGLLSNLANHILVVKTADCFPVFLYDGVYAGLLHVGWRGALAGIARNFFSRASEFNRSKARAFIGPGIGPCCFKVSSEVALLFGRQYRVQKDDQIFIDLSRFIIDELSGFGLKYIFKIDACTACDDENFYSYRREGKKVKQMLSYICPQGG
jgi:YfiH family protein